MYKKKLRNLEQGFTIVEVLIALLIATIFITVAMQMMVFAAIFKVRAQENAAATTWIQEDLENIKFEASQLGLKNVQSMTANDDAATSPLNEADLITVTAHGFNNGDKIMFAGNGIAGGLQTNKIYYVRDRNIDTFKVAETSGGTVIDLTSNSTGDLIVVAAANCGAADTNTGYADSLRDKVNDPTDASLNRTFVASTSTTKLSSDGTAGKSFTLTRNTIPSSDAPYNVLKLTYSVTPTDARTTLSAAASATSTTISVASASGFKVGDRLTIGTDIDSEIQSISGNNITLTSQLGTAQSSGSVVGASIASFYTEVMPNAALYCPTN